MKITRKDEQMMALCLAQAKIFRTCSRRAAAAIIVDERYHVIGTGYNGVPSGMTHCIDGGCPRGQSDVKPGSEYGNCFAIHAEANALLHSDYTANGKYMYVSSEPCFDCAKLIANSTIIGIYYLHDPNFDAEKSMMILHKAGVETCVMGEVESAS